MNINKQKNQKKKINTKWKLLQTTIQMNLEMIRK